MRVGILTFQNANNYGAVLQAYALQDYLLKNGVICEFINYNMDAYKNITKNKILFSKLKDKFLFIKNKKKYIRNKKFIKFRKKFLIINSKEILNDEQIYDLNMGYDVIVVGSDQVWNKKITNNSKVFWGDFAKEIKKVAYAASFGSSITKEDINEETKKYLNHFYAISVREEQAVNILNQNLECDVKHVLDPVFLLTTNDWENIMKEYNVPDKYILIYLLEDVPYINNIINDINKNSEYEIVYISNRNINIPGKRLEDVGPREFLYILKNAEYVVTNSFHGTVFSIILEKNFFVIAHSRYNERIDNMVDLINQKEKLITPNNNFVNKMINGKEVDKRVIKEKINESEEFIESYIISQGE